MKIIIALLLLLCTASVYAIDVELLATDPAPVTAGDYADVTIRFSKGNTEQAPREVSFLIEETQFLTPVSDNPFTVSGLRSGDVVTKTFRIYFDEALPEGFIDIPTVLQTDGGKQDFDLRVFVQEAASDPELYIGELRTTPDELLADTDDNELRVTLQNLGEKDAELVRAELAIPSSLTPSYAYSLVDSVASIPEGGEAELTFTVDIDENARGELPAMLSLRYRAEQSNGQTYDTFTEDLSLLIPVQDTPLLVVTEVEQLDRFRAGTSENRILVTLKNEGEEEAEEVRVRVLPDISYPFIFELTTEYVASEIDPGEEAQVEFTMEVLRSAQAREYPVTVRLESLVGETRYSREDEITITPSAGGGISTGTLGFGLIILAVISAAILGFVMRKRRR